MLLPVTVVMLELEFDELIIRGCWQLALFETKRKESISN